MKHWHKLLLLSLVGLLFAHAVISLVMRFSSGVPQLFTALTFVPFTGAARDYSSCGGNLDVSLEWYPPPKTDINNLTNVIHGDGIYGFIFDSSDGPKNEYNWCNMPRVNPETYPVADEEYEMEYVELIQRHQKRTPYAANVFPTESDTWLCDDELLFFGGEPTGEGALGSTHTYHHVYTSDANPLTPLGFNGTCQFPQITTDGLIDSLNHGTDTKDVYREMIGFLPIHYHIHTITYRVTNNVITSQVASRLVLGMWEGRTDRNQELLIQPPSVDSLEPSYSCKAAENLYASYGPGSSSDAWLAHLRESEPLRKRLDEISGIDPKASGWTRSWDHYFDNLSARLCHQKPLPCRATDDSMDCVTMDDAEQVFRLGEYEYSFIYRDSEESLRASVASFGIWVAEMAQNMRHFMSDEFSSTGPKATSSRVRFRHNIAHDGSIARTALDFTGQSDGLAWYGSRGGI